MSDVLDRAVIELGLDNHLTGPLTAAVEEAEREIDRLGAKKAKIQIDVDTAKARAQLKELEEQQRLSEKALDDYNKKYKDQPESRGGMAKRLAELKAETEATQRATAAKQAEIEKLRLKGQVVQLTGRQISANTQQQVKDDRAASAAAKSRADAEELARTATMRRSAEIQKAVRLNAQYAKSQETVKNLDKAYSRAQGSDKIRVQLDGARALADMEAIREELKLMGRDPIDIKTKVDRPAGVGGFLKSITGGEDPRGIRDIGSELSSLSSKLKSARVNIGPFSTSMRTVLLLGSALAPVIGGLVGTVGALGGAIGAGLGGALGVGGAAMTGFGMALLGSVAAVKPFISQIGKAKTYQDAYNTVVAKYGEGSKQAVAAQKVLNHEMSTVPKQAREAVEGFHDLSTEWKGMVGKVAANDVGNVIGASLKTARADMRWFGSDTTDTLNAVSNGWGKWMQQLRSPKMAGALNNIFENFNASIPSVMAGLGSLGDAFTQIMSSFSNFLPSLGAGFASWAKGIDDAATKSHGFASGVKTMVNAMRDLGHFTSAAGRVLLSFFKAGTGSGLGLINDMTKGLNHLADSMNTVAGQKRLGDFFGRSVGTTKELWGTITSLGSAFLDLGAALHPVASVMLTVVSAFAKAVGWLAGFKPLDYALGGAAALLFISKMTAGLREAGMLMGKLGISALQFGLSLASGGGLKDALGDAKRAFGMTGAGQAGAAAAYAAAIESSSDTGATAMGAAITGASSTGAAKYAAAIEGAGAANTAERAASDIPAVAPAASAVEEAAPAVETAGVAALATETAGLESAALVTAPAVEDVGMSLAAMATGPIGLAVGAIAGLTAGLVLLTGNTDTAKKSEQGLAQTRQAVASGRGNISAAKQNVANTSMPVVSGPNWKASDQDAVNKAAAAYYKIVGEGKKNSDAGRQALQAYTDALESQGTDLQNAKTFQDQVNQGIQKNAKIQAGDELTAQKGVNEAQKAYNEQLKQTNSLGTQLDPKKLAADKKRLADAQQNLNTVNKQAITVANQNALALLNEHRNLADMPKVATQYATSVGSMVRSLAGAGTAGANALHALSEIPDPTKVVQLAHAYQQLHNAADKKTAALDISANVDNPTAAVRQLNALVLKEKVLKIRGDVGPAIDAIKQVNGGKVPDKVLHLLGDANKAIAAHNYVKALADIKKILTIAGEAEGAKAAHAAVKNLANVLKKLTISGNNSDALGKHHAVAGLPDIAKMLTIGGDNSGALSAAGAAVAAINGMSAVIHVIAQVTKKIGFASGGAAAGGWPIAGGHSSPYVDAAQTRAARQAALKPAKKTQGGVYANPTYLIGEENRPEYVIATNPAYRQQNVQYLKAAASSFGMSVEGAAAGREPSKKTKTKAKPQKDDHTDPFNVNPGAPHQTRKQVHETTYNKLAAGDRIGGVGTDDITSKISDLQTTLGNQNQALSTAKTALGEAQRREKSDQHAIDVYNRAKGKHRTASITQDWKDATKDKPKQKAAEKAANREIARMVGTKKQEGAINRTKDSIGRMKHILAVATDRITRFTTLESSIDEVGALMTAAATEDNAKPLALDKNGKPIYNQVAGINPKTGNEEPHTWDEWRKILVSLETTHTNMLRTAYADAVKLSTNTKTHKIDANAAHLGYIGDLASALGKSIGDLDVATTEDEGLSTDDGGGGSSSDGSVTIGSTTYTNPESLSDYLTASGQADMLANYELAITNAQIGEQLHPGDPSYVTQQDQADTNLANFYAAIVQQTQGWGNPARGPGGGRGGWATDPSLINEASQAYLQALQQTTADNLAGQGPTQPQLTATALGSLYANYGGNAANVLLGGPQSAAAALGITSSDMANALAGGQVASQALAAQSSGVSQPSAAPAAQAQTAPAAASHTIINNFQQPPPDPHQWSKGIKWELGAMA